MEEIDQPNFPLLDNDVWILADDGLSGPVIGLEMFDDFFATEQKDFRSTSLPAISGTSFGHSAGVLAHRLLVKAADQGPHRGLVG
jgi:hypothetical protein